MINSEHAVSIFYSRHPRTFCTSSYNTLYDPVQKLQRELDTKRRDLFDQFNHDDATVCWVRAKNTVNSLNRDLNLRYRNKVKSLILLQREAPNEVHPKTKMTRRFSKQVRKAKKERFFKTLERRKQVFNVNSQQFHPVILSSRDLSDDQKSLLSKGPSFCPVPRDINRVKLLEDWEKFENRLRQLCFFIGMMLQTFLALVLVSLSFPLLRKSPVGRPPCPTFLSLNSF